MPLFIVTYSIQETPILGRKENPAKKMAGQG
jgi:hypothetical protein